MKEHEKCPKCGSEDTLVNTCAYWTVHPDTDPSTLTLENCDDGLHINLYFCKDCQEEWGHKHGLG